MSLVSILWMFNVLDKHKHVDFDFIVFSCMLDNPIWYQNIFVSYIHYTPSLQYRYIAVCWFGKQAATNLNLQATYLEGNIKNKIITSYNEYVISYLMQKLKSIKTWKIIF